MKQELPRAIVQALQSASQTVATAESCTGGFVAHHLTNVSGASSVFKQGFITYSNESKIKLLHIPTKVLEVHGAVSKEVAKAMAEGVRAVSNTIFGLATTGFAGPLGGAQSLPVGTVFLAIAEREKETIVWKEFFPERRLNFKKMAVEALLKRFGFVLKIPIKTAIELS